MIGIFRSREYAMIRKTEKIALVHESKNLRIQAILNESKYDLIMVHGIMNGYYIGNLSIRENPTW